MTYLAMERVGKVVVSQQFRKRSSPLLGVVASWDGRGSCPSRHTAQLRRLSGGGEDGWRRMICPTSQGGTKPTPSSLVQVTEEAVA